MTQAARQLTFEEYITLEDSDGLPEGRCEFVDGELVELPPESGSNDAIANYLFLMLVNAGVPFNLVRPHTCEVEVPALKPKDPRTRYPDLVVLRQEHLAFVASRLTIKLDMPPLQLVVEVVSPGDSNRERDYERKRKQYQARGIPEYWLIDPEQQVVIVLQLRAGKYAEIGTFRRNDQIVSPQFSSLILTAEQVFIQCSCQ